MLSYLHIPFCDKKCSYCRFASLGSIQEKKIEIYTSFLEQEIKNKSRHNSLDLLKSVYFGGGTPSTLKDEQLESIISVLKDDIGFTENIEVTIESTPGNITEERLNKWKSLGINRLSIGVQTLNDKSLEEIGRGNKGDIFDALNLIKNVGFENVSIDFIIGLPYVEKGEIKSDIEYILNRYNFIKHISVYMLEEYYSEDKIIETNYDKVTYPSNWDKLGLKDEEYEAEYNEVRTFLEGRGFNFYEISNSAKPGYECVHNRGYWNHEEVLAFGLGAAGFISGERYMNSDNFLKYYSGEELFRNKLTKNDYFLEKIMFSLRTSGLNKEQAKDLDLDKINYFVENNYLDNSGDKITLTNKGVIVMDYILSEII